MDGRIDGTNNVDPHQQHRCTPYTRELGCNRQPIKKKDFNRSMIEEDESKKKETRNEGLAQCTFYLPPRLFS